MYAPAGLVCFGSRQDTERNLAGLQSFDPFDGGDQTASRRDDRRNRNEILLLDISVTQSKFKGRELVAMYAHSASQEHAGRQGKHRSYPSMPVDRHFPNCRELES
jgi:hypothetical protein